MAAVQVPRMAGSTTGRLASTVWLTRAGWALFGAAAEWARMAGALTAVANPTTRTAGALMTRTIFWLPIFMLVSRNFVYEPRRWLLRLVSARPAACRCGRRAGRPLPRGVRARDEWAGPARPRRG